MMDDLHISSNIQHSTHMISGSEENKHNNDSTPNEHALVGWNDELFDKNFLQALDSNDGWGPTRKEYNILKLIIKHTF